MARSGIVALVALVACGTSNAVGAGGEDPPPFVGVPDGIACGGARCDAGAFCIGADGGTQCAAPGAEREAPLGALVMKCDGREDCEAGNRCMAVRGEWNVFQCMDQCDGLGFESVCTSDADCRRCEKLNPEAEVHCKPHVVARHLSVCTSK